MLVYNLNKKEENTIKDKLVFEQRLENIKEDLQKISDIILHLDQIIFNLKSKLLKQKPELTITNVSPSLISRTFNNASKPYHNNPTQSSSDLGSRIP